MDDPIPAIPAIVIVGGEADIPQGAIEQERFLQEMHDAGIDMGYIVRITYPMLFVDDDGLIGRYRTGTRPKSTDPTVNWHAADHGADRHMEELGITEISVIIVTEADYQRWEAMRDTNHSGVRGRLTVDPPQWWVLGVDGVLKNRD